MKRRGMGRRTVTALSVTLMALIMAAGCGPIEEGGSGPVEWVADWMEDEEQGQTAKGDDSDEGRAETPPSEEGERIGEEAEEPIWIPQETENLESLVIPAERQEGDMVSVPQEGGFSDTLSPDTGGVDSGDLSYGNLKGMEFTFSNGAGAWRTTITLKGDGSFTGYYSDMNLGDVGENYPGGTEYVCRFEGRFSPLERVGLYEYAMTCESLTQEGAKGDASITDGIRTVIAHPYGLDAVGECRLYLPGMPVSSLPQSFLDWLWISPEAGPGNGEVLPCYGLYNVNGGQGFCQSA